MLASRAVPFDGFIMSTGAGLPHGGRVRKSVDALMGQTDTRLFYAKNVASFSPTDSAAGKGTGPIDHYAPRCPWERASARHALSRIRSTQGAAHPAEFGLVPELNLPYSALLSGKSSRNWAPRLSLRSIAASVTASETVSKLVKSRAVCQPGLYSRLPGTPTTLAWSQSLWMMLSGFLHLAFHADDTDKRLHFLLQFVLNLVGAVRRACTRGSSGARATV